MKYRLASSGGRFSTGGLSESFNLGTMSLKTVLAAFMESFDTLQPSNANSREQKTNGYSFSSLR